MLRTSLSLLSSLPPPPLPIRTRRLPQRIPRGVSATGARAPSSLRGGGGGRRPSAPSQTPRSTGSPQGCRDGRLPPGACPPGGDWLPAARHGRVRPRAEDSRSFPPSARRRRAPLAGCPGGNKAGGGGEGGGETKGKGSEEGAKRDRGGAAARQGRGGRRGSRCCSLRLAVPRARPGADVVCPPRPL